MVENERDRHLNRRSLQQYVEAGVPAVIKLHVERAAYLIVEPELFRLSLRVARDADSLPDLARYDVLSATEIHWDGRNWYQLSIRGPLVQEAYPLLVDVSDRIHLEGQSFGRAVTLALRSFRDLLAGASRMSQQQEIGLYGELIVLQHLMSSLPERTAISAWRGWDAAEHDFDLGDADLEVKTTISERRQHRISSSTQLMPTTGRPLWLASLQITSASEHSSDAVGLTKLVYRIADRIKDKDLRSDYFDRLVSARWTESTSGVYTNNFRLRSAPARLLVDETFPSITPSKLAALGLGAEVLEIDYTVDLSSRIEPEMMHPLLSSFVG